MANNFKILIHKSETSVHFKLTGDFDGSSAMELIEAFKANANGVSRIFIHTNGLKEIYPFGKNILETNAGSLNSRPVTVVFTGENATRLAPEGSECI